MSRMSKAIWIVVLAGMVILLAGCYSCRTHWKRKGQEVSDEVAHKFYWDKECVPLPQAVPPPFAATECGPYIISRTYPTPDAGVITLEKTMPDEVQVNAPFDYEISVTNVSGVMLDNVKVTEDLSDNFVFAEAQPTAQRDGERLTWLLGTMEPQMSQRIRVWGRARTSECIRQCANVTYDMPTCTFIRVVEPQLKITKTAPRRELICNDIPLTFTVTNEGTGMATNVKIVDELPQGLVTEYGERSIEIQVGSLGAGESREYTILTRAQRTGAFSSSAVSTAAGALRAESIATRTVVTQPVLNITKTGPAKQYLGRRVTYTITLTNDGDSPATETVLEDVLPANVTDISASHGGTTIGSKVIWNLGSIGEGDFREVTLTYTPPTSGTYSSKATATARCAEGAKASVETMIEGIAAILLEVVDISDPIEVGQNETYLITVTNQGTKADTNIRINCFLEKTMKFVSASGETKTRATDGKVVFQPLDSLAPGARATWKVVVQALRPGDVRFRVTLDSDQLTRNVEETEATNFYR